MAGKKEKRRNVRINNALKGWFEARGLDLEAIWQPLTNDLEQQNHHLRGLQEWVIAYEQQSDREELEHMGYVYPPIEPDCDPDTDWLRFDRWMRGEPLRWSYSEAFGAPARLEDLSEDQLPEELDRITANLKSRGVVVTLQEDIPAHLLYAFLENHIEEDFDITSPNCWTVIDGCDGFCPSCFQQSWCEQGDELAWTEGLEELQAGAPSEL